MGKTKYTAIATKPEEIVGCDALDTKDYIQRYNERVNGILSDIKDASLRERVRDTLGTFEEGDDRKLAQSSPYRLVVLQTLLPKEQVLVARPRLQIAKENNPDFMSGFYIDCGLNLVPRKSKREYEQNPIPARELENDLKKVGIKLAEAKLVPYRILIHDVSAISLCGLVFKLSEEGKDTAKNFVSNTNSFKWEYESFNSGLFGACLGGGDWSSGVEDLADSSGSARVVVESAEGISPKILDDIITRRKTAQEKYLAELRACRDEIDRELRANQ